MELTTAADLFTSLGHPGRLAVLRLLIRRLPQGARPSEVSEATGIKPNTLSAHLSALEVAGLIASRRDGRAVLYRAEIARLESLARYVVEDCGYGRLAGQGPEPKEHLMSKVYNVLFICTGNSARSIFAEAILSTLGKGRFTAYSAGTAPAGQINPYALEILQRAGHDTSTLRAKNVTEFQGAGAPRLDFVFTVCDQAATEECPPWQGQPITAHWGLPDPVKVTGTDAEKSLAFNQTYAAMRRRILAFTSLHMDQLDRVALQTSLDAISKE